MKVKHFFELIETYPGFNKLKAWAEDMRKLHVDEEQFRVCLSFDKARSDFLKQLGDYYGLSKRELRIVSIALHDYATGLLGLESHIDEIRYEKTEDSKNK